MYSEQETFVPKDLSGTIREFDRWRSVRLKGASIPPDLWRSATALAAVHGVSKISTELRLDYYALKKRLSEYSDEECGTEKRSGSTPRFVEMSLSCESSKVRCAIEVENRAEDASHRKLRVELEEIALTDLSSLLRSVWSEWA